MEPTGVAISIAFLVLLLFGLIMYIRKQRENHAVTYVCTDCGEADCDCHPEEGSSH